MAKYDVWTSPIEIALVGPDINAGLKIKASKNGFIFCMTIEAATNEEATAKFETEYVQNRKTWADKARAAFAGWALPTTHSIASTKTDNHPF